MTHSSTKHISQLHRMFFIIQARQIQKIGECHFMNQSNTIIKIDNLNKSFGGVKAVKDYRKSV